MSRSLGDLLFTTEPPMSSSPEVMSSRPAIMWRWKKSTKMMIGMVMTTAAAEIGPVGVVNTEPPLKYSMAAGAVRELIVEVNEIASRKSFQQARNTKMAVVTMPGAASGAMTRVNAWKGEAPSILAAFSSSQGISRKKADRV